MQKRINWDKIKKIYPDQWVSIIDPDTTSAGILNSGIVIGNNKDKKTVMSEFKKQKKRGINFRKHTFRYTGKIHNIAGLNRMEIGDV